MAEIAVFCVLALIITEIYARTKHPKLYAFINSVLGIAVMLSTQFFGSGTLCVTPYNSAFSAILGVPGALALFIIGLWR